LTQYGKGSKPLVFVKNIAANFNLITKEKAPKKVLQKKAYFASKNLCA
jgi:hypothetical protein